MKIIFNLEYQTTFGEELAVNIIMDGKTEQHKMGTLDGLHWTCDLSKAVKTCAYIDYYYSVMRGDSEARHEWLGAPPTGAERQEGHLLQSLRPLAGHPRGCLYVLYGFHRVRGCPRVAHG